MATSGNWQKYHTENPFQQLLIRRFLIAVGHLVDQTQATCIADVGCAEGFVSRWLKASRPYLQFTGVDVDREALERGRTVDSLRTVCLGSTYNLPYRTHQFDTVLCVEVLEHLRMPVQALAEIKRITTRYCILSVPFEPWFRTANLLRGKNIARLGDDADHVNHWGVRTFQALVEDAGFQVREMMTPLPWILVLAEKSNDK